MYDIGFKRPTSKRVIDTDGTGGKIIYRKKEEAKKEQGSLKLKKDRDKLSLTRLNMAEARDWLNAKKKLSLTVVYEGLFAKYGTPKHAKSILARVHPIKKQEQRGNKRKRNVDIEVQPPYK